MLCRRLSQVEPENNDQWRNARTSGMGGMCFKLDNGQCEVTDHQMLVWLSQGFLRLTEASCFVNLGVWKLQEVWSLQQAVSLELFHSIKLCVRSHNTFFCKRLHYQFLNQAQQRQNRPLTRLVLSHLLYSLPNCTTCVRHTLFVGLSNHQFLIACNSQKWRGNARRFMTSMTSGTQRVDRRASGRL